jgi:hypothetical protein
MDRGAVRLDDLCQHAVGRTRHFQRDLVRFQFHQDLVAFDGLAGFFFHWISVASETDSESWGTFTSIAAMVFPLGSVWRKLPV